MTNMEVIIECYKPSIECKDFLYTLYINGCFICSLHSLDIIKIKIKKMWHQLKELE